MKRIYFAVVAIIILFVIYYYYIPGKVTPFYSEKQIAEKLMETDTDLQLTKESIRAIFEVDNRHRYVPFMTDEGYTAMSCWEFYQRKWQLVSLTVGDEVLTWNLKPNSLEDAYFIWHFKGNEMATIELYGIIERDFRTMTNANNETDHYYSPEIFMYDSIEINAKHEFGFIRIPKDWEIALTESRIESQGNQILNSLFANQQYVLMQKEILSTTGEVIETTHDKNSMSAYRGIGKSTFDNVGQYVRRQEE